LLNVQSSGRRIAGVARGGAVLPAVSI